MAQGLARSRWRSERGAELVEFAFALPLLLVVFGGIVDFGFMFQRMEVVTNAAREGARLASLPNYSLSDVQSRANAYLDTALGAGTSSKASVSWAPGTVPAGVGPAYQTRTVTVDLTESYFILGPLISLIGGNPADFGAVTLRGVATMRVEMPGP